MTTRPTIRLRSGYRPLPKKCRFEPQLVPKQSRGKPPLNGITNLREGQEVRDYMRRRKVGYG